PGTAITEAQLAEAQRIVNGLNEQYLSLIARGTGKPIEAIRALADGRAIFASDAVSAGLLHGVQSYEATYAQLVAATSGRSQSRGVTLNSQVTKTPPSRSTA